MTNMEWYYKTVRKYREGLDEINQRYDAQLEAKEGYRGSVGYTADVEKIEKERTAEIAALRSECSKAFDACLASMQEHAQARPAVAPTDEQMRLVQLLKLKEHVSRDELEHAANSMGNCGLALSILEEIARAHDILGFHAGGGGVSDQFVQDAIRTLAKSARITLSLERTNQRRQLMNPNGTGDGLWGNSPRIGDIEKFRLDVGPENAQACAGRWGGVPEDVYEAFCKAVDR